MKKGYILIDRKIKVFARKRNRILFFQKHPEIELSDNFKIILEECKNRKTEKRIFEGYEATTYKKQDWVVRELKILTTRNADTIVECVIHMILSKDIKNHMIIGRYASYMIEMYIKDNGEIYVFARKDAEWHFNLKKKKCVFLSCCA